MFKGENMQFNSSTSSSFSKQSSLYQELQKELPKTALVQKTQPMVCDLANSWFMDSLQSSSSSVSSSSSSGSSSGSSKTFVNLTSATQEELQNLVISASESTGKKRTLSEMEDNPTAQIKRVCEEQYRANALEVDQKSQELVQRVFQGEKLPSIAYYSAFEWQKKHEEKARKLKGVDLSLFPKDLQTFIIRQVLDFDFYNGFQPDSCPKVAEAFEKLNKTQNEIFTAYAMFLIIIKEFFDYKNTQVIQKFLGSLKPDAGFTPDQIGVFAYLYCSLQIPDLSFIERLKKMVINKVHEFKDPKNVLRISVIFYQSVKIYRDPEIYWVLVQLLDDYVPKTDPSYDTFMDCFLRIALS
jgi:hypothetical protein